MEKINERKKMIDIKVSEDFLRRILEYEREYLDNTNNRAFYVECQRDIQRTRKCLRMGEPRDKAMRKLYPVKVKDAEKVI